MKISCNWLNDYLKTDLAPQTIGELLTGCGLEVESIEPFESVKGGLRGLVIGEVKEKDKHPNADKLSVTKVDIGTGTWLSIVCGAPNVEAGQKVVVAPVGTTVHPVTGEPFEIKKSKIRGELSEGMICAEDEIGLGTSHAGIMVLPEDAPVGTDAASYFNLKGDSVFEIGLTPNRADAISHFGVARDLAAVLYTEKLLSDHLAELDAAQLPPSDAFSDELPESEIAVQLDNPEACLRYSGIVIKDITVKPSPDWMQQRLQSCGLRPINNVVDVTNYVMLELGQPLHAFDAAKIAGNKIVVRKVAEGTPFVTLDGNERKLSEKDLMICDAEKPMCIAGVFGGQHSGVNETTTTIFLESACFEAVHVRKTSKHHALKTDSSFRFERGSDVNITLFALQRAAYLLREVAGGEMASTPVDIYPVVVEPAEVAFSFHKAERLIGKVIDRGIVKKIIRALGIEILSEGGDALLLAVPPFKVDVKREADVVEEVLRIYGYNRIDVPAQVRGSLSYAPQPDAEKIQHVVSEFLVANGFNELWNNSLTRTVYAEGMTAFGEGEAVAILNPLSSDLGVMRRTLLFGGLEVVTYNQNRKRPDLRLFEFGKVYSKVADNKWPYAEHSRLSLWLTGKQTPESWQQKQEPVSFYQLKQMVEQLLARTGVSPSKAEPLNDELISEGLTYLLGKNELVRFGKLKKNILKKTDTAGDVWWADFNWTNLLKAVGNSKGIRSKELPKFPEVRRDLALVLDRKVTYSEIEQLAFQTEKQLLRNVNLFDVYEGENIGTDKKSYAVSFILQDEEATLTDKQIEKVMEKLTKVYTEKLGAVIRS